MRHGGSLGEARAAYGEPPEGWLDLSTGINPHAYPISLPPRALASLPDPADVERLEALARETYRAPDSAAVVAVPGTQAAIQLLPTLFAPRRVGVLTPTYAEHVSAWARAGHGVREVSALDTDADVMVLVNPNNPDGAVRPQRAILGLAERAETGGFVLVDEAFADIAPAASVAPWAGRPGLVILRSFGKFYGLPGLRLGFVLGPDDLVHRLRDLLGPWAVSGPALDAGLAALGDRAWAAAMRVRLAASALALDACLARHGLAVIGGTLLFRLVETPDAARLHHALARRGLWTRRFTRWPYWLRFGLPRDESGLGRLDHALETALGTTPQPLNHA